MRRSPRSIIDIISEAFFALMLVMIFFGIFLFILNRLFPAGTVFDSIFSPRQQVQNIAREQYNPAEFDTLTATLTRTWNDVKSKRSDDIAWGDAPPGMSLYDRDAVQTYRKSSATINFDPRNTIEMGENSLIIIKRLDQHKTSLEKRSFLVVADGEFRGRFFQSPEEPVYVELATPNAVTRIKGKEGQKDELDFKVTVSPDQVSTFIVYAGQAEVEAQGKSITLHDYQKSTVEMDGTPTGPTALARPVTLKEPADDMEFSYGKLPPEIIFSWQELPLTPGYYFTLTREPSFVDPLIDERVFSNQLKLGNLQEGIFYWRVCSIAGRGDGVYSEVRRVRVRQDLDPPFLDIRFPEGGTVTKDHLEIKGNTEPGANLYIGDAGVPVSANGTFEYLLPLNQGINVIIVEAADDVGNTTYRTELITAKYQTSTEPEK